MSSLNQLRQKYMRAIMAFLFIQPVLLAAVGLYRDTGWMPEAGALAGLALLVFIFHKMLGDGEAVRYLVSVVAVLAPATMVYMLEGNSWQLDAHMYFFAVLAMIVGFCDWRAIVIATATIAVHHILLNFTLSSALYPDGADFARVVFHAVVVILEAGVLIWIAQRVESALDHSDAAVQVANEAKAHAEDLSRQQDTLRAENEIKRREVTLALADQLEQSIGKLADQLDRSADIVNLSAARMADKIKDSQSFTTTVSRNTEDTNATVQTVASAAEELNASIHEIGTQASNSQSIAHQSSAQVQETDTKVRELAEKSRRISEVVTMINEIADRTNLLALNATIEAARAGEAGKGFAVVASEVKSLANQTAQATDTIAQQIASIQSVAEDTATAIGKITSTIQNVTEAAATIAAAVEEQTAATGEITRNINVAAGSTSGVLESVQQIQSSMEEANHVATEMESQASDLKSYAVRLREDLGRCLAELRQAG